MTGPDIGIVEPAAVRIRKRLRTQHARWLARQPVRNSRWFRCKRRSGRGWRRLWIAIGLSCNPILDFLSRFVLGPLLLLLGGLLIVGFPIGLAWVIAVLPAELLMLEPERRIFASESEKISVALTRWAVVSSFAILTLWCMLPGVARTVRLTIRQPNIRKPEPLIRTVKRTRSVLLDLVALRYIVLCGTVLALTSLVGIVIRFPHPGLAVLMSVVGCVSTGWLVWRVGLRLLRHRALLRGPGSIWEYLWFPIGCAGLMMIIPLASDASIRMSEFLSRLGPFGWQMSGLRELGAGNLLSLIPLSGFVVTVSLLGWLAAKDAGRWSNRRKLIESQRLLLNSPIEPMAAAADPGQLSYLRGFAAI